MAFLDETGLSRFKTNLDTLYSPKGHTHTSLSYAGTISGTTDWDDLTSGIYSVASSTSFSSTYNAPVGAYAYGTAIVTSNGSNVSQVYIAHSSGQLYFRERFSSTNDFSDWKKVSVDGHTHTYAGSSTAGGSATTALALTTSAGSNTQPVWFSNGKPTTIMYTIAKSVPSTAVFTDTTYSAGTGLTLSGTTFSHSTSGATAGSYGPSAAISGSAGSGITFNVPYITVDARGHITSISNKSISHAATTLSSLGVTATASELNHLDGITATVTELNYTDGVTSNIQTQLNAKASSSHTHSYLPLTGGTVTGGVLIKNAGLNVNTTPTTNTYSDSFQLQDENGVRMGYMRVYQNTSGYNLLQLEHYRQINSSNYYATFNLGVSSTGAAYFSGSGFASLRNALGLGNTVSYLPVANGGTGVGTLGCLSSSQALYNLGLRAGTSSPSSSGTAGMVYIQYSS